MTHNISFRDRTFRILLAIVLVILFESDRVVAPWHFVLLGAAIFMAATAVINFCPIYKLLGIKTWEVKKLKHDRLNGKPGYHHYYHVNVAWNKNRQGVMCSPELNNASGNGCIEVATPPQFPKGIPGIWSPEHLFTAAVSSCLMTTFLAVAEKKKLDFIAFTCPSEGKLERKDGTWMMTEVKLHPTVTLPDEGARALAMQVIAESVDSCLISNSIKSKISTHPIINIGASAAA